MLLSPVIMQYVLQYTVTMIRSMLFGDPRYFFLFVSSVQCLREIVMCTV